MHVKTNHLESANYQTAQPATGRRSGWLKVGLIAAASALAGGLAAAWWYRNTLHKLNQAENNSAIPDSGISGSGPGDEA